MILVADDDRLARFTLRSLIEEIDPTFEIIEATDGEETISAVRDHNPTVAFVDITMPLCDGLSAITALRALEVDTRFVIVTAHADFEYARRGIELRIEDYLLKPVEPEQLAVLLERLRLEINQDMTLEAADFQGLVVRNYQLWEEDPPVATPVDSARGSFYDAVLLLNAPGGHDDLPAVMATLLREFRYSHDAPMFTAGLLPASIKVSERELRVVLQAPDMDDSQVVAALSQLCERASTPACIVSGLVASGSCLEDVFLGASRFIDQPHLQLLGRPHAVVVPRLRDPEDQVVNFLQGIWRLIDLIHDIDEVKFTKHLSQVKDQHADRQVPLLLTDLNVLASAQLGESISAATIPQFLAQLSDIRRQHANSRTLPRASKIGKIQEYIAQNYARPMTLATIARRYDLTPNYLSTLFREMTGLRFSEYLTQVRMSVAIQLIEADPYASVKELAELTGYASPRQFSDTFRRHTGVLPSQYRAPAG